MFINQEITSKSILSNIIKELDNKFTPALPAVGTERPNCFGCAHHELRENWWTGKVTWDCGKGLYYGDYCPILGGTYSAWRHWEI